jgi:hypothetical protein
MRGIEESKVVSVRGDAMRLKVAIADPRLRETHPPVS